MGKLTRGRIARIIDEIEKGEPSVHGIANRAKVPTQWVYEGWRRSGQGRVVPEVGRSDPEEKEETVDREG